MRFQSQKVNDLLCKVLGHVPVGAPGTTHVWCDRCDKYLGITSQVFPKKIFLS